MMIDKFMKILALLLVQLALSSSSQAGTGLYVTDAGPHGGTRTTAGFDGISGLAAEQSFVYGTLRTDLAGTLTFTYLGSEAGHTDKFFSFGDLKFNNRASNTNTPFSVAIAAGEALNFSFQDTTSNRVVSNGANVASWGNLHNANSWQNTIGLLKESDTSYLLLYNDYVSGGDRDYDDMVVRVSLAPVPEPETYTLLLAGLGLIGGIARRRKMV